MAQISNNFLKGKMNKDLDARLLQNGEYRNAINAQVSKSEGANVGALENVLGNILVQDFKVLTGVNDLKSIGYLTEEINNTIYIFLTNNTIAQYDTNAKNFIISYNSLQDTYVTLVEGAFLNFSQLNPIYGVNILERLLFWTDNRNQPRKINVDNASTFGYYTTEDQISVAKYNPYESIELWKETSVVGEYETTMFDVFNKFYPNGGSANSTGPLNIATNVITLSDSTKQGFIEVGATVGYIDQDGALVTTPAKVILVVVNNNEIDVTLDQDIVIPNLSTPEIIFSFNPYFENTFSADADFLKDKFVRFSYRFQFDDNEYSIFAPFTQPAFIPEQDGYFMYKGDLTDEEDTYRSTVVDFMQNKVNKIELRIPLPANKNEIRSVFNINSIEILYKESDALAVKVIETIQTDRLEFINQGGVANVFTYEYNSKKPFKTLPSDEITRVFDKVPVRAFSQEISANRVIYGNFQTQHTPPDFLNYNVAVGEKTFEIIPTTATVSAASTGATINISAQTGIINVGDEYVQNIVRPNPTVVSVSTNTITISIAVTVIAGQTITFTGSELSNPSNKVSKVEYPSSSLKTNRTYQVGVVLSDKFGRQSTVILSSADLTAAGINSPLFGGSTIFSDYINNQTDIAKFPGNALRVLFNDPISPTVPNSTTGEPGIYNSDVTDKFYNPLGWYSYKIVVKQQEQEYYNVYLPGVMAAYPEDSTLELGKTSHAVLINDNINKVPRDLSEVGPTQKQFRSSVELNGRVENLNSVPTQPALTNQQFYPARVRSIVSTIASNDDLFNGDDVVGYIPSQEFYSIESNPFIARISTTKKFGVTEENITTTLDAAAADVDTLTVASSTGLQIGDRINGIGVLAGTVIVEVVSGSSTSIKVNQKQTLANTTVLTFFSSQPITNVQNLAIFETDPVISELDIFWESSSSGLITELNKAIIANANSASGLSNFDTSLFTEAIVPSATSNIGIGTIGLLDQLGANVSPYAINQLVLTSVIDFNGQDRSAEFDFQDVTGSGLIGAYSVFVTGDTNNPYYFFGDPIASRKFTFTFTSTVNGSSTVFTEIITLGNVVPTILDTSLCGTIIEVTQGSGTIIGDILTLHAVNGSAWPINKATELQWNLVVTGNATSQDFAISTSTVVDFNGTGDSVLKCVLSVQNNSIGAGSYGLKLVAKDSGNLEAACIFVVKVASTDINPIKSGSPGDEFPDYDFDASGNIQQVKMDWFDATDGTSRTITLPADGTVFCRTVQGTSISWALINPPPSIPVPDRTGTFTKVESCGIGIPGGGPIP